MYQVIFGHVSDSGESVLAEGTKAACQKEIARRKSEARKHHTVWGWCNGGYSVPGTYYIELRAA